MHRLASVATSSASHTGILSTPIAYGSAPRTSTPGIMVMRKIYRIFCTSVDTLPVYRRPLRMQRECCKMPRRRGEGCSHRSQYPDAAHRFPGHSARCDTGTRESQLCRGALDCGVAREG